MHCARCCGRRGRRATDAFQARKRAAKWNAIQCRRVFNEKTITARETPEMRGLLLWLIGIPLPIVLLLYLLGYL